MRRRLLCLVAAELAIVAAVAPPGASASSAAVAWSGLADAPSASFPKRDAAPDYVLNTLPAADFPLATCLDGASQGAYYYRPAATPSAATKIRIFFEGGGWCVSDADCLARSKTALGTNKGLKPTSPEPAGYCGSALLSDDAAVNPSIWDWASVYVPYCDGSSYTGSVVDSVPVGAENITYRGRWIRDALVPHLASAHGLAAATDVIVGGCSAGGLTVYLNLDAIAGQIHALSPGARVRGLADAGFFLDAPDWQGQPLRTPLFQWGFDAWNSSAALSPACLASFAPAGEQWRCIFAQYMTPFIVTPLFVLNSRFDQCQLAGCELNMPDANSGWAKLTAEEKAVAVSYSQNFSAALTNTGVYWGAVPHGGWVSSCYVHCDAGDAAWNSTLAPPMAGTGNDGPSATPSEAFAMWLNATAAPITWSEHSGAFIPAGSDILSASMTVAEAKARCAGIPACSGFTFAGSGPGPFDVLLKGSSMLASGSNWTSFVLAAPPRIFYIDASVAPDLNPTC